MIPGLMYPEVDTATIQHVVQVYDHAQVCTASGGYIRDPQLGMKKRQANPNQDEQMKQVTTTVAGIENAQPWFRKFLDEIRSMDNLPQDWNDNGAAPPNATAKGTAANVLLWLSNVDVEPTRIDPSADEAVCIAFQRGRRYADIECYNSGEMIAIISDGCRNRKIWQVTSSTLGSSIKEIFDHMAG